MEMRITEAAEKLGLVELTNIMEKSELVIGSVYICDLLSWVMGRAPADSAWITVQGHINIVAVAILAEVSCIIVVEGADVDQATIDKANEENIPLFRTDKPAYKVAVEFSALGI